MSKSVPDDASTIDEIVQRQLDRFPDIPVAMVREVVISAFNELHDASVRDFVSALVEKKAKKTLKATEAI